MPRPHFPPLAAILLALLIASAHVASAYQPPAPSLPVASIRYTWHDTARDRDVPVKIYYPATGAGPFPIIIFSHGLGGNREGYEYLGNHWAACGYVSVHLQHLGSDDAVWKNAGPLAATAALYKSVADINNAINRAKDVPFAIDLVLKLNTAADSPLRGRLDTKHIGMAGHSFGGWTTMALVGEQRRPGDPSLADPRITAGIEMSAPVPRTQAERDHAFSAITTPVFHMTGTLDNSPIGETKAADRRIIFDEMNRAETCLVIFNGADHMTFSGHIIPHQSDKEFQPFILAGSTAYWDAYLKGNAAAKDWLYNGGFATLIGEKGTFEKKLPH
ncbi:MAG: dienelactone hydrolase [Chthoniobacteraceae bacterium]